jgi:site-specific recombinase XerD
MKSEPPSRPRKKNLTWTIDESKCLTLEEVKMLRNALDESLKQGLVQKRFSLIRDSFMIELGLKTGLRVQEMASLKHENLFLEDPRSSITVIGKGQKKRSVWISSDFKKICKNYIKSKESFNYPTDNESFLLNNIKGNQITKRSLQKAFKTLAKKAGLPSRYHIHNLRHTYSTFLLKASQNDFRFLQKQLGHSSITTTQVYASVLESEARNSLEKMYR